MRYSSWDMEWDSQNFVILGHFLTFYPPNNQENQNLSKMKKASWDVITLHMCTKNQNHMMYASQVMEYNRHNFLSFWVTLCHFIPLLTPKIKISNKCKKNPGDIVLSHMCNINEDHMMCGSWDKKAQRTEFFCHFGPFFALWPS